MSRSSEPTLWISFVKRYLGSMGRLRIRCTNAQPFGDCIHCDNCFVDLIIVSLSQGRCVRRFICLEGSNCKKSWREYVVRPQQIFVGAARQAYARYAALDASGLSIPLLLFLWLILHPTCVKASRVFLPRSVLCELYIGSALGIALWGICKRVVT